METRHAKRRRKANTADEPFYMDRRSYLDELPSDVLEVILRHLSVRPHLRDWQAQLDPWHALRVLECGGQLRAAARRAFYGLHMHFDCLPMHRQKRSGLQLDRGGHSSLFGDLVLELGPRLRVLTFDVYGASGLCDGSMFEFCCNLRTLALGSGNSKMNISAILSKCGSSLCQLHFGRDDGKLRKHIVPAIAAHCQKLESLTLEHETCEGTLEPLWTAIGGSLRHLAFGPPASVSRSNRAFALEEAAILSQRCAKLQSLELLARARRTWQTRVAPYLRQLGSSLLKLRLTTYGSYPGPVPLSAALENCTNVELYLSIQTSQMAATMTVFGDRLRAVHIPHGLLRQHHFDDGVIDCAQLEELQLPLITECAPLVARLFHTPKPHLRVLELSKCLNLRDNNFLNAIADRISSIEEFTVGSIYPVDFVTIERFLIVNSRLRRITIIHKLVDSADKAVQICAERCGATFISNLPRFLSVMEVQFQYSSHRRFSRLIADACVPLRGRYIDIIVGYMQYMPQSKLKAKNISC